jgi:hypothetical protein
VSACSHEITLYFTGTNHRQVHSVISLSYIIVGNGSYCKNESALWSCVRLILGSLESELGYVWCSVRIPDTVPSPDFGEAFAIDRRGKFHTKCSAPLHVVESPFWGMRVPLVFGGTPLHAWSRYYFRCYINHMPLPHNSDILLSVLRRCKIKSKNRNDLQSPVHLGERRADTRLGHTACALDLLRLILLRHLPPHPVTLMLVLLHARSLLQSSSVNGVVRCGLF